MLAYQLKILTGRIKRIAIVQDRQPQGCGCRAYMEVFTACLEQWLSFLSVLVIISLQASISDSVAGSALQHQIKLNDFSLKIHSLFQNP
jgi:hypothetical protein